MKPKGTYVYCLVAASRKPAVGRVPRGLPGTGPVRLLEDTMSPEPRDLKRWLVAADAPLARFGEDAINGRLHDLDWVSRAAVAHEGVVESFVAAPALLPMKLFTIFTSDERALAHIAQRRDHVRTILERVTRRDEWGVRVVLDRARAIAPAADRSRRAAKAATGAGYLAGKKAMRDAQSRLASQARIVIADLNDLLAHHSSLARRRGARDLPVQGGPLLLDAAYLVDRARARAFRSMLAREARRLEPEGYRVSLSGPWPPYSFLE
jgi:hypothetical protein